MNPKSKIQHLKWAPAVLLAISLRAEVPEPDNVVWGAISLAGQPVTALQTNVVVEARKTSSGPVVARYRMGEAPAYGDYYSLRIPLEGFLPLTDTNASRIGALVYLTVRDDSGARVQRNTSIPSRGKFTRLDFAETDSDGDGLPDGWEQRYFASSTGADPQADPDGDGRSNRAEFLAQTNPLLADGRHPADLAPADNALSFEEMDDYIAAWLIGDSWLIEPTNVPIAYVTRAAALWLGGENYLFTNAPPTNAPMWWVNNPPFMLGHGPGTNFVRSELPATMPSEPVLIPVHVIPQETVLVHAIEETVPPGWIISDISHGGVFDAINRKVKWGPFFDAGERQLSYVATPPPNVSDAVFAGVASFDGVDVTIPSRRVMSTAEGSLPHFTAAGLADTGPCFLLRGASSASLIIEVSTNLIDWSVLETVTTDVTGCQLLRPTNAGGSEQRFYRARVP